MNGASTGGQVAGEGTAGVSARRQSPLFPDFKGLKLVKIEGWEGPKRASLAHTQELQ